MGLFKKKAVVQSYDKENKKPVIKSSICNGEQVAGFKYIADEDKLEKVLENPQVIKVTRPHAESSNRQTEASAKTI